MTSGDAPPAFKLSMSVRKSPMEGTLAAVSSQAKVPVLIHCVSHLNSYTEFFYFRHTFDAAVAAAARPPVREGIAEKEISDA